MHKPAWFRLERYTIKRPQEVLLVTACVAGEIDQVVIFKGYSSSVMRPTAADADVPVLPEHATILRIDRLQSPYNPDAACYIEQDITWEAMQQRLLEVSE